jgi:hypothetical protein
MGQPVSVDSHGLINNNNNNIIGTALTNSNGSGYIEINSDLSGISTSTNLYSLMIISLRNTPIIKKELDKRNISLNGDSKKIIEKIINCNDLLPLLLGINPLLDEEIVYKLKMR